MPGQHQSLQILLVIGYEFIFIFGLTKKPMEFLSTGVSALQDM